MNTISTVTNNLFKILVVDDSKYMRLMLRKFLEEDGYVVIEAENGLEALTLFAQESPDLVLMDCVMPFMDGFTACAKLQAEYDTERTPVLMVTSLADDQAVDMAFAAGAADYITKPIHWAVLRQRVRRILKVKQAEILLAKSEAFARSVINCAQDGIITVDIHGLIKLFNLASEAILVFQLSKYWVKRLTYLFLVCISKVYLIKVGNISVAEKMGRNSPWN